MSRTIARGLAAAVSVTCTARAAAGGDTPRPSRDGAAAPSALRLEKRTHLDARYRVILREFAPGVAEVGWSFVSAAAPTKAGRGGSALFLENQTRAARRARSRLRHLVLTLRADHLLTLTYRANVRDFGKACRDLNKFIRRVRRLKPGWQYVAVAEEQSRGAWHWHLAVCGRQDAALLRACWRHVVGEGNIDVSAPGQRGRNEAMALVRYLGKYISKGFSGGRVLNARRFRSSIGIQVPMESLRLPEEYERDALSFAIMELGRRTNSVGFLWHKEDRSAGWACSWK